MNKFQVGDIVTGIPGNGYYYTTDQAVMRVVSVLGDGSMRVRILSASLMDGHTGEEFLVYADKFRAVGAPAAPVNSVAHDPVPTYSLPLPTPDLKNREKWIAALRSGKYSQAKSVLRKNDDYCCLGVACDLYVKSGGELKIRGNDRTGAFTFNDSKARLPFEVQKWLGLKTDVGAFGDKSLAQLNDSGRFDFNQIADVIEGAAQLLFTEEK